MKYKNIIKNTIITGSLLCSLGLTSCNDYLTVLPTNAVVEEDFWKSKSDVDNARAGAYTKLSESGTISRIIYWGELRSDNVRLNDMTQNNIRLLQNATLMPTDGNFDWTNFYQGINYCNRVIEHGDAMTIEGQEVDPSFRLSDWRPIKAELQAVRALYYFYLVRAYRNVPYVMKAVTTDVEARNLRTAATEGVNILGDQIRILENEALKYSPSNLGTTANNKGRFTTPSIHALLADMYLWRSGMLKFSNDKGDKVLSVSGDTLSSSEADALSATCLDSAIYHCDKVLDYFQKEFEKEKLTNILLQNSQDTYRNKNYPYLLLIGQSSRREDLLNVSDLIFNTVFGDKNSSESLLELQYDGSSNSNTAVTGLYSLYSNSQVTPEDVTGSNTLTSPANSQVNPDRGYGKTDIRLLENFDYKSSNASAPPISKFINRSVSITNLRQVTDGSFNSPRSQASANWPLYRLADIMLIKAEAIARKFPANTEAMATDGKDGLNEGFKLVNAIFSRSNPGLYGEDVETNTDDEFYNTRCNDDYALKVESKGQKAKTANDLLVLVYNERQREFFGEGKRWFDLVRQAEFTNDPTTTLSNFISLSTSVRNRLKKLWGMYNPIYQEEYKVNGVRYGGGLVQNPVWERYMTDK